MVVNELVIMTRSALLPHFQAQSVLPVTQRSHMARSLAAVLVLQASVLGRHTVALLLAERVAPVLQISTRATARMSRVRRCELRPYKARTRDASAARARA